MVVIGDGKECRVDVVSNLLGGPAFRVSWESPVQIAAIRKTVGPVPFLKQAIGMARVPYAERVTE